LTEDPEISLAKVPTEEPAPDIAAASSEEGEVVRRALLKLPESYRAVLILRHYEGLKLREIGEVLEIPEGTVNSRMAEALARLSRILEPLFQNNPSEISNPMKDVSYEASQT
jgi:RNA polymerase sigma-70 factor (ECF subfamily)